MAQEILLIFLVFMKALSFDFYCLTYFVLESPVADPQLIQSVIDQQISQELEKFIALIVNLPLKIVFEMLSCVW